MKPHDQSFSSQFNSICKRLNIKPLIQIYKKGTSSMITTLNVVEQLNEKNDKLIAELQQDISDLTQFRLPGLKQVPQDLRQVIVQLVAKMPNLCDLHVSLGDSDPQFFEKLVESVMYNCKNLKNLELFSCSLSDNDCPPLQALISCSSSLESLKLSDNQITGKGLFALALDMDKCPTLLTFHIGGNKIFDGVPNLCERLIDTNVTSLGLRNTGLRDSGLLALGFLLDARTCKLQDLQLRKNSISEEGMREFSKLLKGNNSLRVLELQECGLTAKAIQFLAEGLAFNQHLHALTLNSNGFGDEAALSVGKIIAGCPSLTTLQLDSCGISCDFIIQLVKQISRAPTQLAGLSVAKNKIAKPGFLTLGKIVAAGQLSSLNLSGNEVVGADVVEFAQILNSSKIVKLKHLDLSGNNVGDEGAESLAGVLTQNMSLQRLFLTDCAIGENGGRALAAALESNFTLLHMQYGGQGSKGNQISKATRQSIDQKLRKNVEDAHGSQQFGSQLNLGMMPPGLTGSTFEDVTSFARVQSGMFAVESQSSFQIQSGLRNILSENNFKLPDGRIDSFGSFQSIQFQKEEPPLQLLMTQPIPSPKYQLTMKPSSGLKLSGKPPDQNNTKKDQ